MEHESRRRRQRSRERLIAPVRHPARCRLRAPSALFAISCLAQVPASITAAQPSDTSHRLDVDGVMLSIPGEMTERARAAAASDQPGSNYRVFIDQANPTLNMWVIESEPIATPVPANADRVPMAYASALTSALAGELGAVKIVGVKPGRMDEQRSALEVGFVTRGASPAFLMLQQPNSSSLWNPVRESRTDLEQVRCWITALLDGHDAADLSALNARLGRVVEHCGVDRERLSRFVEAAAHTFAPQLRNFATVAFLSPTRTVYAMVSAPVGLTRRSEKLQREVFDNSTLAPERLAAQQSFAWGERLGRGIVGVFQGMSILSALALAGLFVRRQRWFKLGKAR